MPYVPEISLYIFVVSPEKHEIDFLLALKQIHFQQIDSITLGVHSVVCTKYYKQQI